MILSNKDYIFCKDCNEYIDFWRYDNSIKETNHINHNWRYVNDKELKMCIKDCIDDGCLKLVNGEYLEND